MARLHFDIQMSVIGQDSDRLSAFPPYPYQPLFDDTSLPSIAFLKRPKSLKPKLRIPNSARIACAKTGKFQTHASQDKFPTIARHLHHCKIAHAPNEVSIYSGIVTVVLRLSPDDEKSGITRKRSTSSPASHCQDGYLHETRRRKCTTAATNLPIT